MSNINVIMPTIDGSDGNGLFKIEWTFLKKASLVSDVSKANHNIGPSELMNDKIAIYDFLIGHYYGTVATSGQIGNIALLNQSDTFRFPNVNQTVTFDEKVLFFKNIKTYGKGYTNDMVSAMFGISGTTNSSSNPFLINCKYVGANLTFEGWGGKIVML